MSNLKFYGGSLDDKSDLFNGIDVNDLELGELLNDVNTNISCVTNDFDNFMNTLDLDDALDVFTEEFLDNFTDCKTLSKFDEIHKENSQKSHYSAELRTSISEPILKRKPATLDSRETHLKRRVSNSSLLPLSGAYFDFSNVTDEAAHTMFPNEKEKSKVTFPMKLHTIVERSEIDGYSSIISWQPHGRAFKIHDQKLFLEKVISRFFYQSNIQSFLRQLKIYGFQKMSGEGSTDKGAYFHELFLRGRPGLCAWMGRFKSRSIDEPNFMNMPPVRFTSADKNHYQILPLRFHDKTEDLSPTSNNCLRAIHYVDYFNNTADTDVIKRGPQFVPDKATSSTNVFTGRSNNYIRKGLSPSYNFTNSSCPNMLHQSSMPTTINNVLSSEVNLRGALYSTSQAGKVMQLQPLPGNYKPIRTSISHAKSSFVPQRKLYLPGHRIATHPPPSVTSQKKEYSLSKGYPKNMSYIFQRGFSL